MRRLVVREERWPLAAAFVIARGSKREARVVVVEITQDGARGRGECVPYARYGETVEGVLADIESLRTSVETGLDRVALQARLPAGAARNALDCALWDLQAKRAGVRVWDLLGRDAPRPVETAYTLSLGTRDEVARAARDASGRPLLKLKIGAGDDLDCVEALRHAAPQPRLIVDANEALDFDALRRLAPEFARLRVDVIEQPLPAGADEALEGWPSPVTLCADESLHTRADLALCARRYGCANIKLDKTGGLSEALALQTAVRAAGLSVMIGCMVATSLAMAPALLLAQGAAFADLDGPLLLSHDRPEGLAIAGSTLQPPSSALWG